MSYVVVVLYVQCDSSHILNEPGPRSARSVSPFLALQFRYEDVRGIVQLLDSSIGYTLVISSYSVIHRCTQMVYLAQPGRLPHWQSQSLAETLTSFDNSYRLGIIIFTEPD
jgi:hypothetical protein